MSVQRSSALLSLMSSRIAFLDHRHAPRTGITTKSTDHPAGTSPTGRKPCKKVCLLGVTISGAQRLPFPKTS